MRLATTALLSFLLFTISGTGEQDTTHNKVIARCYGYTPCNACSNCSQCGYCSNGGTCGKCTRAKTPTPKSQLPQQSGQCKATTKKGTRCSRAAGSSGYCWQHEN
jgi:hypothetical protein